MGKVLLDKMKESFLSVLPVVVIVAVLSFTPVLELRVEEAVVFAVCGFLLVLGIGLFNMGADIAMTPMGEHIGTGLIKHRSLFLLLGVCFLMGMLITIAEPDLTVLSEQVKDVINPKLLIIFVSVGVGIFLLISACKIVFKRDLSALLMFFYCALFAVAAVLCETGKGDFLSVGFDSGGVTTGPITVPFIMALGVGVASAIGGRQAKENSFGLIAMCSVGPILAVLILGLGGDGSISFSDPEYAIVADGLAQKILTTVISVAEEVAIALGLIIAFFIVLNFTVLHVPAKQLKRMGVGILYTYVGLVIFLASVSIGFMPIGYKIGKMIASFSHEFLIIFGFILGAAVVLAEPAVHVLNRQVEEITDGTVSRKSMMIALSVGVGISICLSMIRIVFKFSILYYVVPGYLISLGLSFFVPKIYTAIAFDSGGVASGPLTSGFILPLAIGASIVVGGVESVMSNAFGIVAMVAMTPLITIQLLGFRAVTTRKVKEKIAMHRILESDDARIIDFM